ncbi:unnamed protein product, partial [Iphiclides podalirius]
MERRRSVRLKPTKEADLFGIKSSSGPSISASCEFIPAVIIAIQLTAAQSSLGLRFIESDGSPSGGGRAVVKMAVLSPPRITSGGLGTAAHLIRHVQARIDVR